LIGSAAHWVAAAVTGGPGPASTELAMAPASLPVLQDSTRRRGRLVRRFIHQPRVAPPRRLALVEAPGGGGLAPQEARPLITSQEPPEAGLLEARRAPDQARDVAPQD